MNLFFTFPVSAIKLTAGKTNSYVQKIFKVSGREGLWKKPAQTYEKR